MLLLNWFGYGIKMQRILVRFADPNKLAVIVFENDVFTFASYKISLWLFPFKLSISFVGRLRVNVHYWQKEMSIKILLNVTPKSQWITTITPNIPYTKKNTNKTTKNKAVHQLTSNAKLYTNNHTKMKRLGIIGQLYFNSIETCQLSLADDCCFQSSFNDRD